MRPIDLHYLQNARQQFSRGFLAGCDEAGRGCLAGPVVAACASLSWEANPDSLDFPPRDSLGDSIVDSKKLSPLERADILDQLLPYDWQQFCNQKRATLFSSNGWCLQVSVAEVSAEKIDQINILQASLLAMKKSFTLEGDGILLVDGPYVPSGLNCAVPIVKGDQKSWFIALASIFAKEYRDTLMKNYADEFPAYGFEKHKGYPTKEHLHALKAVGISTIHRRTFKPVKSL